MPNELTNTNANLPAHLRGFAAEVNSDLTSGVSLGFPILSYKGKVWHLVEGDNRQLIVDDETGEPRSSIEVVILKANPHISKTYYPSGFEEGSSERPICLSNDSIAPSPESSEPQATKCAICPHNQFGSKITENGARGKACSDFRRLAVAPSGDLERAMLLRVPAASLKELVAYGEALSKRKVPYQALVTRVGFDHSVAYPKLAFKMVRWLDEQEVETVREMMDSEVVRRITSMGELASSAEAAPASDDDIGQPPAHAQRVAEAPAPAPKAAKGAKAKAAATEAEIDAALSAPAAETPKENTAGGFGGGKKTEPKASTELPPDPDAGAQEERVTVLAAGALAELDAVLGEFDD